MSFKSNNKKIWEEIMDCEYSNRHFYTHQILTLNYNHDKKTITGCFQYSYLDNFVWEGLAGPEWKDQFIEKFTEHLFNKHPDSEIEIEIDKQLRIPTLKEVLDNAHVL